MLVDDFGEPYEVRCPHCSEKILSTARKCKHCGEWLQSPGAAVPSQGDAPIAPATGSGAKTLGWVLLVVGLIWLFVASAKDTTVAAGTDGSERWHNVGLMNEKQNQMILAGVISVVGVGLVVAGYGSGKR